MWDLGSLINETPSAPSGWMVCTVPALVLCGIEVLLSMKHQLRLDGRHSIGTSAMWDLGSLVHETPSAPSGRMVRTVLPPSRLHCLPVRPSHPPTWPLHSFHCSLVHLGAMPTSPFHLHPPANRNQPQNEQPSWTCRQRHMQKMASSQPQNNALQQGLQGAGGNVVLGDNFNGDDFTRENGIAFGKAPRGGEKDDHS